MLKFSRFISLWTI